jgi:hypothetical protein
MTGRLVLAFVALVFTGHAALADDHPDATKTPGAILGTVPDDQVASCLSDKTGTSVQVNDPITVGLVCTPGYSKCIRNVPQAEKDAVYQSYALAGNHTGYCDTQQGCEIDHLISLELGGSNDHPTSSNMTRHFIPNSRLQRPGGPIAPPTFWTVSIVPGRPGCITSFLSSRTGSGLFPRISAAPGTARLIEFE